MCIWRHKLCNSKTGVGPTFTWSNEPGILMFSSCLVSSLLPAGPALRPGGGAEEGLPPDREAGGQGRGGGQGHGRAGQGPRQHRQLRLRLRGHRLFL